MPLSVLIPIGFKKKSSQMYIDLFKQIMGSMT